MALRGKPPAVAFIIGIKAEVRKLSFLKKLSFFRVQSLPLQHCHIGLPFLEKGKHGELRREFRQAQLPGVRLSLSKSQSNAYPYGTRQIISL
jgi:hypothetical protein